MQREAGIISTQVQIQYSWITFARVLLTIYFKSQMDTERVDAPKAQ